MSNREYFDLTPHELEAMLYTVENSLKVYRRFQFFLWAQNGLHRFIPHETLLCVWGDIAANRFQYDIFSQNTAHERAVHDFARPIDGLLAELVAEWRRRGAVPCLLVDGEDSNWPEAVRAKLRRYGLGHVLAHGAKEMGGDSGSFFVFFNLPRAPAGRDAYIAELLMPHMHMALHRMANNDTDAGKQATSAEAALSEREIEVLRWVREGKTNQEIGLILAISQLTVKNHVQKILRKLNASNRAQAVAKWAGSHVFAIDGGKTSSGRQ